MSDMLTHWAVFDDCRRLAQQDAAMEPLFVQLIQTEREAARLGSLSRGGSRWVPDILGRARGQWPAAGDKVLLGKKMAYALGGITHHAADAVLKPIMSRLTQTDWDTAHHRMQAQPEGAEEDNAAVRELSAYYDVYVFRQVYLSGQEEPFSRFLVAANTSEPGRALEEYVRALFQRALLASHTLSPDSRNIDGWLDHLFAQLQPLYLDIDLYTRVFNQPEAEKMRRYQVETVFYRSEDPIVRAARTVQRGGTLGAAELEAALTPEANEGGYGRALEMGLRLLRGASAYWRGEVNAPPDLHR